MERRLCVYSTHTAAVSALGYQPVRRELITGHEDGSLKFWEGDTGKHTETVQQHKGWISDLFYWTEGKVLFSCSVDGQVVLWSSSNQPYDIILVGEPVFSLMWLSRKNLLLFGTARGLGALRRSGRLAANGLLLLSHRVSWLLGHSGIVRCLNSTGNKIYTAGYDRRLLVHEVASLSGEGESPLKTLHVNNTAHDAGITCLQVAKDTDGSAWVVTGSFDKRVKLWTGDGKPVHIISCSDTVTGLCYMPQTRVVWVAAGTSLPLLYEPKSGENVTEYAPILNMTSVTNHGNRESVVLLLKYIPETTEVIGSTKLKELVCWKYNMACALCSHQSPSPSHIETLTFTSKVPILLFSGSFSGEMVKWEQLQLNSFLYSQDTLGYKDALLKALDSEEDSSTKSGQRTTVAVTGNGGNTISQGGRADSGGSQGGRADSGKREKEKVQSTGQNTDPLKRRKTEAMKAEQRGFVCSLFVESLDLLVASTLDGTIMVWGYDKHTVRLLEEMQGGTGEPTTPSAAAAHQVNGDLDTASEKESSSVISRVAGFTCLHVLRAHQGTVQALTAVEHWTDDGHSYLISGGWDLTLCVWDLRNGRQVARLEESLPKGYQLHPNLVITSMAFSPHRSEFAYATSDGQVFVRRFDLCPERWDLVRTLEGHRGEVTQVCWNEVTDNWVTGSLDGTLRLWAGQEGEEAEQCVSVGDPVSVVCVNQTSGHVVAGAHSTLRVYNHNLELLQVSRGHTDTIRTIIHIPDRKQYVSASWDGTVKFWRAHH